MKTDNKDFPSFTIIFYILMYPHFQYKLFITMDYTYYYILYVLNQEHCQPIDK